MTEIVLSELINNVAFPIFVSIWLLVRDRKELKDLKEALNNNTLVMKELVTIMKEKLS